jgi:hypothetical protein
MAPAAEQNISLSQAILAPLDAILKAQLHAARSFLSLLLQLGYPHQPLKEGEKEGVQGTDEKKTWSDGTPYMLEFAHEVEEGGERRRQKIRVPALALVPVAPLAVQSAEFRFAMSVHEVAAHRQMRASAGDAVKEDEGDADEFKRPWFLVSEPVSVRGTIAAPTAPTDSTTQDARIEVEIKLAAIPIPAGLDRLLTGLTQVTQLTTQPSGGGK